MPTLILKADTTEAGRASNQASVAEMPRVKLVHIDDAGHNVQRENLEMVIDEISGFLSDIL